MPLDQRYALPDQDFFAYFKVSGSTMKPVLNLIQEQEKKKKKKNSPRNERKEPARERERIASVPWWCPTRSSMCNAAASSLFLTITLGDKCCCESSNDSTDEVTKAQKGRWSVCAEPRTEDKQRQDLDSCFYLFHQPTEHPRPGQQGYRNQNPWGHGAQSLWSKARHLLSSSLASGWQRGSLRPGSICI